MIINYILAITFAISAVVSALSWYQLETDYLERNKLSEWRRFWIGKRAFKEIMKGDPVIVRRHIISNAIALISITILFIGNLVKSNG